MIAAAAPAQRRGLSPAGATLHLLRVLLPVLLACYAFLDRGFAWLHIPGTPIFAGEVTLAIGVLGILVGTGYFRGGMAGRPPIALLVLFALWGALLTGRMLPVYGLDAVRDAALWYYAPIAVVVVGLCAAFPDLPERWAAAYARVLPWLVLWSVAAVLLLRNGGAGPLVPGSAVPIFSHKPGNVAVQMTIALAFVWIVPGGTAGLRRRTVISVITSVVILMAGSLNRGGLIAAAAGLALALWLNPRHLRMAGSVLAVLVLLATVAGTLELSVPGEHHREISVAQVLQNAGSVSGGGPTSLSTTVAWRDELWQGVINRTVEQGRLLAGWSFGPNLARAVGLQGQGPDPLRSPHNSHLDVLARMGLIGAGLWAAFWISWYALLLSGRRRLRACPPRRRLLDVVLVGVTATLVNAYFDPTLEGPQVALWLWTLVGLGVAMVPRRERAA
jgi:hypothetical protein